METRHFFAVDLGATSGRTIIGTFEDGKFSMRELTRFPSALVENGRQKNWDINFLFGELLKGLKAAAEEGLEITSIGIDTWGVDFCHIGSDGKLIGLPRAYRDPYTDGIPAKFFADAMPLEALYGKTGIQVMNFNSVFQIYAQHLSDDPQLAAADKLLFMPDALSYMLTGNMVTEYTIASTSAILNPVTKKMDADILKAAGVSEDIFAPVVYPGHVVGTLKPEICDLTGMKPVPVIAVAGHDTGSAVAAVPALTEKFAYLSSGTWSLMGIEAKDPVISERTMELNLTNEGGVEGTTRLLKNITGMWILEQCMKQWKAAGRAYTYPEVVALSKEAPAFAHFIDPDAACFAAPDNMLEAIDAYCAATGQSKPVTDGEYVRCIYESLSLKYASVMGYFKELSVPGIEVLHVIGGGSKNALLCQMTANALGMKVVAGPSEGTAIGNIMIQAKAAGMVDSLPEMRKIISECIDTVTYEPEDGRIWADALAKFLETTNNNL